MADFDPDAYLAKTQTPAGSAAGVTPVPQTNAGPVASDTSTSGSFDPDAYLHSAFQTQQSRKSTPADIPELKAATEPGFWDKVKTEARNAISPIIGDSPEQKMTRESSLEQLRSISPTLAARVQESVNPEQDEFQRHGAVGTFGKAVDTALQGGGAAGGAELGAMTGPAAPVAIPLLTAAGSVLGNYLGQKRRIAQGEQKDVHPGELAGAAISGPVPGGALAKTGTGAVISQGIKQGLGGLAAETARSEIDENQLPTMRNAAWAFILPALTGSVAEHAQQSSPEIMAARKAAEGSIASKAATLKAGQDLGMVVEPSQVNPSLANKAIEGLAGGASIKQAASHINQDVADEVAKRVLSPANPDVDLTSDLAKAVRQRAFENGYAPIAKVGSIATDPQYQADLKNILAKYQGAARSFPGAANADVEDLVKGVSVDKFDTGDALKMVQILRDKASDAFTQGNGGVGQAARSASKAIEGQIERHLTSQSGSPQGAQMLNDFRDARKLMAQSHDIEDAIREGGGSVIPSVLARKSQSQSPMTGDLKTVGDFANNFPSMTREGAKTPVPGTTLGSGVGRLVTGSLLGGATAATTHSPEAATLAATAGILLPNLRGLVRSMVLSGPYQRIMAKYPVNVEAHPDTGALLIRQGGQAATLQGDSTDK